MYEQFANEVAGSNGLALSDIDEIACKVIEGNLTLSEYINTIGDSIFIRFSSSTVLKNMKRYMYHNSIVPTTGESFDTQCVFTEYIEYTKYDDEYIGCISRRGRVALMLIFAVYLRMNNMDIVQWDEEMSSIISNLSPIKSVEDEKKACLYSLHTCLDLYSKGVPIAYLVYCIYPVAKSDFDTLEEFALSTWECDSIEQIQELLFKETSDDTLNKYMAPIFKQNWENGGTEKVYDAGYTIALLALYGGIKNN